MKAIKHDLGDFKEVSILPIADLHLGDIRSDFKKISGYLDYIKETPNAFTILNGDLMDAAIASSIGDTYGASLQPMEQLSQCVKLFEPIKEKVLAVLPGNHEERIYRQDGLDLTQIMCNQLGIGERYADTGALLFVRVGSNVREHNERKVSYTIYATHGRGSGRTEGAKVKRLSDLASIVDADIYIHSHTHLPIIFKQSFFRVNMGNSSVAKVDKLFVNTGSTLDFGGYAETAGFKPASLETPIIRLDGTRKRMTAAL